MSWQFERKGIVIVDKSPPTRTTSCSPPLDAGAEDVEDSGDTWQVTTPPTELHAVRTAIEEAGITVEAPTSR